MYSPNVYNRFIKYITKKDKANEKQKSNKNISKYYLSKKNLIPPIPKTIINQYIQMYPKQHI